MKYSFAVAAFIAAAFAAPQPGTETVDVTVVETITSCAADVTNCPARSSTTAVTTVTSSSVITTTATSSTSTSTKAPLSTSVSSKPTSAPVTVGPVGTSPVSSGVAPSGTASCGPGHSGYPGFSGSAVGPKASGSGTGVKSASTPSSSPITPVTGGAAQNAAGLLAGVGAFAALFL